MKEECMRSKEGRLCVTEVSEYMSNNAALMTFGIHSTDLV